VSADGRFVVFMSRVDLATAHSRQPLTDLPDRNGVADIYLRDTQHHTTTRITRSFSGGDANGPSYHPAISSDGRYVAFASEASNLVRKARGRLAQVYVHDRSTGITALVSRTPAGRAGNGASLRPAISGDGSRIAFESLASDLVCGPGCPAGQSDTDLLPDVFLHDRTTGRTIRTSIDHGMERAATRAPALDDGGRVLVFASHHPGIGHDETGGDDLFVMRPASLRQDPGGADLPSPDRPATLAGAEHVSEAPSPADDRSTREASVVARALLLVPGGERLTVRIVDPDLTGDPKAVRQLDAFIVRERSGSLRPIVYVNRRSAILSHAATGSDFHLKILAAVLYHEACHLRGFDEAEAAQAERAFVERLIALGLVSPTIARRYLELMRSNDSRGIQTRE
jgi:Tol biopolymer transport system component